MGCFFALLGFWHWASIYGNVRLFLHSSLSKCSWLLQDCSRVPQPAGPADARGAAHRGEEAAPSSLFRADVISSIS